MENRAFRKFEWSAWNLLDCRNPRASGGHKRPLKPLTYRRPPSPHPPLWKFLYVYMKFSSLIREKFKPLSDDVVIDRSCLVEWREMEENTSICIAEHARFWGWKEVLRGSNPRWGQNFKRHLHCQRKWSNQWRKTNDDQIHQQRHSSRGVWVQVKINLIHTACYSLARVV